MTRLVLVVTAGLLVIGLRLLAQYCWKERN